MSEAYGPRTDEAIAIVGEDRRRSNFALDARTHVRELERNGGAELARVLGSQPVDSILGRYKALDQIALARQRRFRRLCGWTLITIALLTYFSLFALALPLSEDHQRSARFWALVAIYAGMFIGFAGMTWLHITRPDVAWRQARAGAELERMHLFDTVMEADRDGRDLLRLKLEYVRRYQLDLQEDYYRWRGAQHEARVRRSFRWKLFFFLFALLAVAAMAATHFLDKGENGASPMNERLLSLLLDFEVAYADLFLLLMALALALWWAVSQTLAQIEGTARNATLFAIARDKLVALRNSELDAVRRAADEGDESKVRAFVTKLQSILLSEHQGWLSLENEAPSKRQS